MKAKLIYIDRECKEEYGRTTIMDYSVNIDENLPSCNVGIGITRPTTSRLEEELILAIKTNIQITNHIH